MKLWASAFGGEIKSIAAKYSGSQLLQKVNGAVLICAVNTTNKTALKDMSWYSLKYLVIVMLYAFGDHSVPCYLSKYYHLIPTLCHVLLFKGHTLLFDYKVLAPFVVSFHHTEMCVCVCFCSCSYILSHTQVHVNTHTHTHTHTHAHAHAHAHTLTCTHTHTHSHTHTHVGFCGLRGLSIGVMVFILYKLYVLLPYTYPTPKLSPHRRLCASLDFQKNTI